MPSTKTLIAMALVAAAVVWAANNIDAVKNAIGDDGWF